MKKYLYLFFVAILATMSFALTSCGDDDDEPNNGTNNSAFTVDGKAVIIDEYSEVTNYLWNGNERTTFEVDFHPSNYDEMDPSTYYPSTHIAIYADLFDPKTHKSGDNLSGLDGFVEYMTSGTAGKKFNMYKSGSITHKGIKGDRITFSFNNVVYTDGASSITLNGTFTCDFEEVD